MKKKKYQNILDSHHVARRCSNQKLALNENNKIIGIDVSFLQLRQDYKDKRTGRIKPEKSLSCSWLEHFGEDRKISVPSICNAISQKFPTKPGKPVNAKLAILNVGQIKICGNMHGIKIRAINMPKPGDPSYSQISGLPLNNSNVELTQALCLLA